ncbi:MAG TPA: protoheme IX farnesyltransferase, partial [Rhodospirillaceae bacterium]|nr:protoheme IX farnesyltransferase [Rhodospirillaceae bacterium]
DIDALMSRTASRPLPGGRIAPDDALGFAIILALFSVLLMGLATNWVAAGLLALAILFYLFVYTIWLKRRTPQNIVIGGAAGAFPPMIGWAAVNGDVSFVSLSLFAIIFLWTPPHFWALALYRSGDYDCAGVPMMPVVAGSRSTKRQMLVYTLFLVPASLVPFMLGAAGLLYATGVGLLGLFFIVSATRVLREASDAGHRCARQMFSFSILYLFLVFALLLVDSLLVLAG